MDTQRIEFNLDESSVLVLLPHNLGGLTPEAFVTSRKTPRPLLK